MSPSLSTHRGSMDSTSSSGSVASSSPSDLSSSPNDFTLAGYTLTMRNYHNGLWKEARWQAEHEAKLRKNEDKSAGIERLVKKKSITRPSK